MSKKSIAFHVENNDYFATLATVISLMRQDKENIKNNIGVLRNIEKDLMYLQKDYKIIKK